jgi:sulfate/thiosulfate transport system permease protein
MAGYVTHRTAGAASRPGVESGWVKWLLILAASVLVILLLVLPLLSVFAEAFSRGPRVYFSALVDEHTLAAIRITATIAVLVVPMNTVFGLAAAWAIAKFQFRGRALLLTLIDLPFAVSPVVVGVMLLVLFGAQGFFGLWLRDHDIRIVFALPGMVLATVFVTFPMVARELIPLMQQQGTDPEQAALTLGASGWRTFWQVTLPSVKWGVLYGVILASARSVGEFGAVYVVSKPIPGEMPLPLWVDNLNTEHKGTAAFAVASLLVFLALGTLALRLWLERLQERAQDTGSLAGPPVTPEPAEGTTVFHK